MITTLNKIRAYEPCSDGWKKLLQHLDKTEADDESLSIVTILESNGIDDALWALRAVEGHDREIRLFAVWCARRVQHLMPDQRSIDALHVAELYAYEQATDDELGAARAAAWGAARTAALAAAAAQGRRMAPAGAAAEASAWAAAWDAVRGAQESELRRVCAAIDAARASTLPSRSVRGGRYDPYHPLANGVQECHPVKSTI